MPEEKLKEEYFEIAGEKFEKRYFPNLYRMYEASPQNAEEQLRSVADAWHEGKIVSAAQALESDLAHLL